MGLSKDAVKAVEDRPIEQFPMPEWGGTVAIRPLTLAQILELRDTPKDGPDWQRSWLRFGLVDEATGLPNWTDEEIEQLYREKHPQSLNRLQARLVELHTRGEGPPKGN